VAQLDAEDSGLQRIEPVIAVEHVAALGRALWPAVIAAEDFGRQGPVVGGDGPGIAEGTEILAGIEAEAADGAERARPPATPSGAVGLRRILDQRQAMTLAGRRWREPLGGRLLASGDAMDGFGHGGGLGEGRSAERRSLRPLGDRGHGDGPTRGDGAIDGVEHGDHGEAAPTVGQGFGLAANTVDEVAILELQRLLAGKPGRDDVAVAIGARYRSSARIALVFARPPRSSATSSTSVGGYRGGRVEVEGSGAGAAMRHRLARAIGDGVAEAAAPGAFSRSAAAPSGPGGGRSRRRQRRCCR
jgi:hypothetical protein